MRSGTLRHRITLQQDAGTADAAGEVIENWTTWLANEPAEVMETGGGESLRGQQIDATATHVVRIRYRANVTEQLRIVWETRILGIVNVRDIDGRRRELWITAREVKV